MEMALIGIGALLLIGIAAVIWQLRSNKQAPAPGGVDPQALLLIQSQLADLTKVLDGKLTESTRFMQDSLRVQSTESNKIIRDIVTELTKVGEGQKQVMSFTEQLRSLQDILKNPKQRGILGEYYLETLLKNVLPPGSYQMQYPFKDGTIVDCAVFVKDKVIPIDSKFSLENYNRISETNDPSEKAKYEKLFVNDLKNRIIETAKYIQPSQNTTEFAFMFIPHEAIYYDLLVNTIGAVTEETDSLIQRAASKYKVIIVSPTSFLAYLQTVLQGLKALHVEESVKTVIKNVEQLGKHIGSYEQAYLKLGNSLTTTVSHFNTGYKELKKIDKDVLKITGSSSGFESIVIDAPTRDE
jgi:DNA recombination protein RmuC